MRLGLWIALAAGIATAFGFYFVRDYPFWQDAVLGAAVMMLVWSVMRTGRRLKDLYRRPE